MDRLKFKRALTLIELMLVLAIFSIIAGAIFATLATGRTSWNSGNAQMDVQQEARKGMDRMVKELREAGSGVTSITGAGTIITFQVPVDWDNDGDITDNNGNVEWGAPLHSSCKNPDCEGANNNCHNQNFQVRYLINNDQLVRRVLDGAGNQVREDVLANNISGVLFTGADTIDIQISAQKNTIQGHSIDIILNSQVNLRN